MKFNKTVTFEAAKKRHQLSLLDEQKGDKLQILHAESLASECQEEATGLGLAGTFVKLQTDFNAASAIANGHSGRRYRDEPHWPSEKRQKVKRVRFVVCTLATIGISLGLMSRLLLNVSIVEMVKKTKVSSHSGGGEPDRLIQAPTESDLVIDEKISEFATMSSELLHTEQMIVDENVSGENDDLRFDWDENQVNILLASVYFGYAPGVLFGGSIAEHFGAKGPLFTSIFGTAVINFIIPSVARWNIYALMVLRAILGLIQGSLLPALYELFNKWLTQTESSIFVPLLKVSMAFGSLMGTILPGIMAYYNLRWPILFYAGGTTSLIWSIIWLFLADSAPQSSRFVGRDELNRIMRKKQQPQLSVITMANQCDAKDKPKEPETSPTPWLLIITSPSVLALALVKFTYNIGVDFLFIMLPTYLSKSFDAPTEKISFISSSCFVMQMSLVTVIGWLAKEAVTKRAFGLSVTKWRKIFQGGSNLLMAMTFLVLAVLPPNFELSAGGLMVVCFFWMLGAGGESMIPYDLSTKYPASILSFSHSFGILSGIAVPIITSFVVGKNQEDPSSWSRLFLLLGGLQAFGGIVFSLLLKAKPFLPEEKLPNPAVANDRANKANHK